MNEFVKKLEELPLLAKVILAIPGLDLIWMIYRVCKSYNADDKLGIIVWLIIGVSFGLNVLAIIDIIFILLTGNVIWVKLEK